jgi:hypothetical protein
MFKAQDGRFHAVSGPRLARLPSLSGFERGGTRVGKRSNPRSEQSGDSLTCPSFLFSLGVHLLRAHHFL